ncbi:hypothetical protein AAIP55_002239 [Flavobacterium psychrophilum]|nr:hypothetical protein [Flavobacterium psychrophilum]EKT4518246.1 hypothetical protein [Flavobacterium psychrophilum]EKT4552151.1 hypothetical protein [Flavobacterium psychrophilum]
MTKDTVKFSLKEKWNINAYDFWIPLHGKVEENTCYFEVEDFENNIGYEKLTQIIKEINTGNIYSFNEAKEEKVYAEIYFVQYTSPDIFFTNENVEWVIYQTHEETISFAGKELIDRIKSLWKNWPEKINPWEKL